MVHQPPIQEHNVNILELKWNGPPTTYPGTQGVNILELKWSGPPTTYPGTQC